MHINLLVAGIEVGGSCAAAVFIKDVKTFEEMMDEVIAQRNQFSQIILGLRVALRRHRDIKAHAGPSDINKLAAGAGVIIPSSLDFR